MSDSAFFITTAIDYTNAGPHIGHAYEKVLADTLARFKRLQGHPVFFLTGVDQHGQKVAQSAAKAGVEPMDFAAENTAKFLELWKTLELSHDGWAATTDPRHHAVVQKILTRLHDAGILYKARHTGYYSVRQEQFLTDKERGEDGEFGPEWGEVTLLEEENWYFPLLPHRDWLIELLQKREDLVFPAFRKNEVLHALERLSGDLCISRPKERLAWGIEFPFDPGFVTYVWFDALINYLSFAGYLNENGDPSLPEFDKLWPCDAHVIGKDILVPSHSVYWPIMLRAMGFSDEQMPKLLVHGWWNLRGEKVSKSTGNVIDPAALAERYGVSGLRYFLMRDITTGHDSDFSEERIRTRYQADLANDLGNLLNRTLNMTHRYLGGVLRAGLPAAPGAERLRETAEALPARYCAAMERYEIHLALEAIWELVVAANAFVESSAPWKLAKDPAQADVLASVLYDLNEALRIVSVLIEPVMPSATRAMHAQLQWTARPHIESASWGGFQDGHTVGNGTPLFPRIEEAEKT